MDPDTNQRSSDKPSVRAARRSSANKKNVPSSISSKGGKPSGVKIRAKDNSRYVKSTTSLQHGDKAKHRSKTEQAFKRSISKVFLEDPAAPKHMMTRSIAQTIDRRLFLKQTIKDFAIYFIFLFCCLYQAAYLHSRKTFDLHRAMESQFTRREFKTQDSYITFNDITTATDTWACLEKLADIIFQEYIYEQEIDPIRPTKGDERNILFQNKVLGVGRLRQVRVRNNSCTIPYAFNKFLSVCYAAFSPEAADDKPFGPGNSTAWTYQSEEEVNAVPMAGFTSYYTGDGYVQDLAPTKNETLQIIKELKDQYWIDEGTRAVFVDFFIFNANLNSFIACKLVFEFPHIGGVIPVSRFDAAILTHLMNLYYKSVLICMMTTYIITIFYLVEAIREIVYFKLAYFLNFWPYVDVSLVIISLNALVVIASQYNKALLILSRANTHQAEYCNLEWSIHNYKKYKNLIAIQIFFAIIRSFKYLNYNKTMDHLNKTIKKCRKDVLGFSLMFTIVFMVFAEVAYLEFGDKVESLADFPTSLFSLIKMMLGEFDYAEIERANRFMAIIFFLSFVFFMFFVLANMFLAIMNDAYVDVSTEMALSPDELQMSQYVKEIVNNFLIKIGLKKEMTVREKFSMTVDEVEDTMIQCGFTDNQIEAFLNKYLKGPYLDLDMNMKLLADDLATQHDVLLNIIKSGEHATDMFQYQGKMERVKEAVRVCSSKVADLTKKINSLYVKKKRKPQPK